MLKGSYILIAVTAVLLSMQAAAQGQRESPDKIIAAIMERLIENAESDIDYTDLQDQLEFYAGHKLNLNKATREQLQRLIFLNEGQVNAIINHRLLFGDFLALYELQSIAVMDEVTLYYLTYFVTTDVDWTGDQASFAHMVRFGKHEITGMYDTEFQKRSGYDAQRKADGRTYYLGDPSREVIRYRCSYGNRLYFGYAGEKDMGEQFARGAQRYGFDFNSFHFFYKPRKGIVKAVALGDYQANFGQGLTFGSGTTSRKSAFVQQVRRNFPALRPSRSLNENEFLRGAAVTLEKRSLQLVLFASAKYITTNFEQDSLAQQSAFSSVSLSGLHRTEAEAARRNNIFQQIYGGSARWQLKGNRIGITHVQGIYSQRLEAGGKPYQLHHFSGMQLSNTGIDYSLQWRNMHVSGELSQSDNGARAFISSLVMSLDMNLDVALLYRNYAKGYRTVFSNAFGEYSDNRNETGWYTGVSLKLSRRWTWNAYLDLYRSDWLRYLTDGPSRGSDVLSELQYAPSKNTQLYFRYRTENKQKNQPNNVAVTDYLSMQKRSIYRFHAQYKIGTNLTAKSRIEVATYSDYNAKNKTGALLFQDLSWSTPKRKLALTVRMAYFTVEDYNARIYASESDVLYQYSVPLYQNSGTRYYLVARYQLSRRIEFWLKFSETIYSNVKNIGSGLEQINGNRVSDLRLFFRVIL